MTRKKLVYLSSRLMHHRHRHIVPEGAKEINTWPMSPGEQQENAIVITVW